MTTWLRRLLSVIVIISYIPQGLAQSPNLGTVTADDDIYRSRISEYFFMKTGKEVLKPVRLLGHVEKPGLYHLPEQTPLSYLLALSGGVYRGGGEVKQVVVTSPDGQQKKAQIDDLFRTGSDIALKEGDIVYVPKEQYFFNERTTTVMIAIASVLSVGLTGYVIFRNQ